MSRTLDLFAESARLHLPDHYRIAGNILGNPVQQLLQPAKLSDARLTPLQQGALKGFLAETSDRMIAIVGRNTVARLPAPATLLVPDASSVDAVSSALEAGTGRWLAPKRTSSSSVALGDAEAACRDVIASWHEGFIFQQERLASDGSRTVGLRAPQAGALHAVMAHWSVSNRPGTIVMPTGTGKTEAMLGLLVSHRLERVLVVVPTDALRTRDLPEVSPPRRARRVRLSDPRCAIPHRGNASARPPNRR